MVSMAPKFQLLDILLKYDSQNQWKSLVICLREKEVHIEI